MGITINAILSAFDTIGAIPTTGQFFQPGDQYSPPYCCGLTVLVLAHVIGSIHYDDIVRELSAWDDPRRHEEIIFSELKYPFPELTRESVQAFVAGWNDVNADDNSDDPIFHVGRGACEAVFQRGTE